MSTKSEECENEVHDDTETLFGKHCEICGNMSIYADDSLYMSTSDCRTDNQRRINENFFRIVNFLNSAGLEVNQGKTNLTEYMSRQKRCRITGTTPTLEVTESIDGILTDKIITDKMYCRTLGGNIRNDMSWDAHLNTGKKALLPSVRKLLGSLHSLRKVLSQKAKLQLVNSFIGGKLNYIMCVWGNTSVCQIKKAQICLNSAARFVLDAKRTEKQTKLMSGCNWLNIVDRIEYCSLIQFWKVIRWNTPTYFADKIILETEDFVFSAAPRLLITANSWRCKTTLRWNCLPTYLRTEVNHLKFKKYLKKYLIQRRIEQGRSDLIPDLDPDPDPDLDPDTD